MPPLVFDGIRSRIFVMNSFKFYQSIFVVLTVAVSIEVGKASSSLAVAEEVSFNPAEAKQYLGLSYSKNWVQLEIVCNHVQFVEGAQKSVDFYKSKNDHVGARSGERELSDMKKMLGDRRGPLEKQHGPLNIDKVCRRSL